MFPEADVYILVETDKDIYNWGETVNIALILVNNEETEITLNSTALRLEIPPSSFGRLTFDLRVEPVTIPPNSTCPLLSIVWDQRDADGNLVWGGHLYNLYLSLLL